MTTIELTVDGELNRYEIPDSFTELTVEQYIELVPIISEEDSFTRTRRLINYFTELEEYIDYLKEDTILEIVSAFNYLFDTVDEYKEHKITQFEHNGTIYAVKSNLDSMTFGEKEYINKIKDIINEDIYKSIPYIASVVTTEEGKEQGYSLKDLQNKARTFYQLKCSTAFALFFSIIDGNNQFHGTTKSYLNHLNQQIQKLSQQV